jgi:hypothetical protein
VFAVSFFFHHARLPLGTDEWSGQQCQKHPSRNTASLAAGKTKSGLTGLSVFSFNAAALGTMRWWRRQPATCAFRKAEASLFSVDRLRVERIDRMTADRFAALKMSLMLGG